MPVQDSNAERRNLTVTSLAFVAYYYCGGSIANDQLTIQVVSVKFARPDLLALLAWVSLFWFLLRYWQTNRGKFRKAFLIELGNYRQKHFLIRYIERITGLKPMRDGGFSPTAIWPYDGRLGARYSVIGEGNYAADGTLQSNTVASEGVVQFSGIRGKAVLLRLLATCAFENASFAEYVAPYLLFVVAICGPIYRGAL